MENIYNECKNLRLRLGLTLEDIAKDTGYSRQYIHKFESGKSNNNRILLHYIKLGLEVDKYEC